MLNIQIIVLSQNEKINIANVIRLRRIPKGSKVNGMLKDNA
ncbi:hypothetical protein SAMN05660493_00653 [Epilithonimonas bovis DSM 19482]|jgi:ribosomal protein L2|uniref:Uncharacterized protein n=1 Tax=Epilithonimonas bovis DSM 19482 TaxID=1121284 RepID=A0A1U7PVK2_9FLAO|nr:hypothetical protein SAMN05660493_00653 [Epilithonimonas bovis DSM 19482]